MKKEMVMAASAAVLRGADKKHTTSSLKRGWNWAYRFYEKTLPDGTRKTLVVEYQLLHRKYGTDVIVSNYPGAHQYEDAAWEAICEAFRDFFVAADEEGVVWQEVRERIFLTAWLIDAPIDSEIIRSFAAALEVTNRVSVEMKAGGVSESRIRQAVNKLEFLHSHSGYAVKTKQTKEN